MVVFNPLTQPLDEPIELALQIPVDWPKFNEFFGYEPKPAFRIYDAEGRELPYQRLAQLNNRRNVRIYEVKFPEEYRSHAVAVSVPLRLPALGYTTLIVRAERSGQATRHPAAGSLAVAENSMENEHLRVTVEANGTLTLLDKRSGATYRRLLTFEDCADIGDGWYHGQAVNDQVYVSTASAAAVALVHNGPQVATFRVRTTMAVPAELHFDDRMRRSAELVELILDSFVTLRAGRTASRLRRLYIMLRWITACGCSSPAAPRPTPIFPTRLLTSSNARLRWTRTITCTVSSRWKPSHR